MFRALRHPATALLILGLMSLVVVPKRWLHDCDTGFHAHTTAGTSVAEDGHCPLCETVIPAPVVATVGVLIVPIGTMEVVSPDEVRSILGPARLLASVRGPPCLG